jgi:hypothetical protein
MPLQMQRPDLRSGTSVINLLWRLYRRNGLITPRSIKEVGHAVGFTVNRASNLSGLF